MKRLVLTLLVCCVAACGGGGNPLGNPPTVSNPDGSGETGQKLSYAYYQRCVHPVLLAQLRTDLNGVIANNTCAGAGCHDATSGSGGSLRIVPGAAVVDLADAAVTPEAIRASDMYKNFYSTQGATVPASPELSRLLTKPMLAGVLHGGGLIFENVDDPNAKLFAYWISRPAPADEDEFSAASDSMFTPPDPMRGTCNTLP